MLRFIPFFAFVLSLTACIGENAADSNDIQVVGPTPILGAATTRPTETENETDKANSIGENAQTNSELSNENIAETLTIDEAVAATPTNNNADGTSTDNSTELPPIGNTVATPVADNTAEELIATEPPIVPLSECQNAPALAPIEVTDPGKSVVIVETGDQLGAAVYEAQPNTVILIEPGEYILDYTLAVTADNVTIRGNSDNCNDIHLVGKGMENASGADDVPHGIFTQANFLKVQNLTIENVYYHAITIQAGAQQPHIYNVAMLDTGQQFVKANGADGNGSNNGRLEYSVMKYTNGSPITDHGPGIGYTQGISLHGGDNWLISNNRFENINTADTADHLWNPAVLVWDVSRNTIVENNLFINVDRAIAFGLQERIDGQDDHSGGIIRNNMIMMRENFYSQQRKSNADAPIIIWSSPNTEVLHNTILTNGNTPKAIELRFNSNNAVISNNLTDAPISDRSSNEYIAEGNALIIDASIFQNPTVGDLRLVSEVDGITKAAVTLDNATQDIDGNNRGIIVTDVGADEL